MSNQLANNVRPIPSAHKSKLTPALSRRILSAVNEMLKANYSSLEEFKQAMRSIPAYERPLVDVNRQARLLTYIVKRRLSCIEHVGVEQVLTVTSQPLKCPVIADQVGEFLIMFGCVPVNRLIPDIRKQMSRAAIMHWGKEAIAESKRHPATTAKELVNA